MSDSIYVVLGIIFVVCIFALVIWWTVAQWGECRDMGFSIFYCIKHVS